MNNSLARRTHYYTRILSQVIRHCSQYAFVPKHSPCENWAVDRLQEFVDNHLKIFVLTGAGISTESGIPDYRSEGVGLYATSNKRPVQFKVSRRYMWYDILNLRICCVICNGLSNSTVISSFLF